MSKYDPLFDYLLNLKQKEWRATFDAIERILGFELPPSASNHSAWWENEKKGAHVQARVWMAAGWRTSDVNLTGKTVTFERVK